MSTRYSSACRAACFRTVLVRADPARTRKTGAGPDHPAKAPRCGPEEATGEIPMGVFRSMRDLTHQAREIERSIPPVGDRMAAAQGRMARADRMMAAQTQAAS